MVIVVKVVAEEEEVQWTFSVVGEVVDLAGEEVVDQWVC